LRLAAGRPQGKVRVRIVGLHSGIETQQTLLSNCRYLEVSHGGA